MTTPNDLRALAERATPGPWEQSALKTWVCKRGLIIAEAVPISEQGHPVPRDRDLEQRKANTAYIAAASPDRIVALLEERDRANRALVIWLDAMVTGRSEPLFIARDHTKRLLGEIALRSALPDPPDQQP